MLSRVARSVCLVRVAGEVKQLTVIPRRVIDELVARIGDMRVASEATPNSPYSLCRCAGLTIDNPSMFSGTVSG